MGNTSIHANLWKKLKEFQLRDLIRPSGGYPDQNWMEFYSGFNSVWYGLEFRNNLTLRVLLKIHDDGHNTILEEFWREDNLTRV